MKSNNNCRFDIDFVEFCFLVEACIPPAPIARAMFWDSVIDRYYHVLTDKERKTLYNWIKETYSFQRGIEEGNEDCLLFQARFNPDNQWAVTTNYNGETKVNDCFRWQGKYYIHKSTHISEEYIVDAVQKTFPLTP